MKLADGIKTYFVARGMARALRHRDFVIYSVTHTISAVGFWMQRVAVLWLTWELTHSGLWLGIIAATEALPMFLLLPLGGVIADRVDRLWLYRMVQILLSGLALILALFVLADWINIYILTVIMAGHGVANALSMPVRMTVVPGVVPREDVSPAIAFDSIMFQGSVFVGPALAGVVIAGLGIGWAMIFNTLGYLIFLGGLLFMRYRYHEHVPNRKTGVMSDMAEGLRYLVKHPGLGPMLLLITAATILTRPYIELMPGFADVVFGREVRGFSILFASVGVGGIAANLWIAHYGRTDGLTRIVMGSIMAASLLLVLFATITIFWIAVVLVAVISFMSAIGGTGSQILMQNGVEGAMRGRVMSLYALNWRGAPALGALVLGWSSTRIGLQAPVAIAAVLCLIATAWLYRGRLTIAEGLEDRPDKTEKPAAAQMPAPDPG